MRLPRATRQLRDSVLKEVREIPEQTPISNGQVKTIITRHLLFTGDDGGNFSLIWPNPIFLCQINERITFLLVMQGSKVNIHSFYLHGAGGWVEWPLRDEQAIAHPISKREKLLASSLLILLIATIILPIRILSNYELVAPVFIIPIVGVLFMILRRSRRRLEHVLVAVQKAVQFS